MKKKKIKVTKITPLEPMEKDGTINPNANSLNLDWIRSARLLKKIKAGDKKAKAEWDRLEAEEVVEIDFVIEEEEDEKE